MRLVHVGGRWIWPDAVLGVYGVGPDCTDPVPVDCQTIAHHDVFGLLFDRRPMNEVVDAINLTRATQVAK